MWWTNFPLLAFLLTAYLSSPANRASVVHGPLLSSPLAEDVATPKLVRVSVASGGTFCGNCHAGFNSCACSGLAFYDRDGAQQTLSADGRFVAFQSYANNL